jgi:hypothetical protein
LHTCAFHHGRSKDGFALPLTRDKDCGKDQTNNSQSSGNTKTDNETSVLLEFFGFGQVLFIEILAFKVISGSTKVVIVTGSVERIAKALLDRHLVKLPIVKLRMIDLTIVVLAVQASGGLAFIETSLHDKKALTSVRHGATAIPLVTWSICLVESIRALNSGAVATGVVLPGMTFGHGLVFWTGDLLVEIVQVTLVDFRIISKQRTSDSVVGIVFNVKEPHGVTLVLIVDDFKGISPHDFAKLGARCVNVLELGARGVNSSSNGGSEEEECSRCFRKLDHDVTCFVVCLDVIDV